MSQRIVIEVWCKHCETAEPVPARCPFPVRSEPLVLDEMVEKVQEAMSQVLFAGVLIPDKDEARAVLVAALGLEETDV